MIDRKFLDDTEKYPDELEFQVGPEGMKVRLGDLRAYDQEQRGHLDTWQKRSNHLEGEYGKLANQYNELRALYDQVAQQMEAAKQGGQTTLKDELLKALGGNQNPTVMDKPGEFFAPIVKKLQELDTLIADQKQFKEDLRKELVSAFGFQVNKDMKRDFRGYEWPKDFTLQSAIEYANQYQMLEPGSRYPDFDRIHDNVTAPIRAAAEREEQVKAARDEGYKQAREEFNQNGAIVPQPGFGGAVVASQLKSKFGGIDKIPDETILNDPDIWTQVQQ